MFVDTSYATEKGRVSVTGECIFVNEDLISYKTKKQTIFTESVIEAEYVGLTIAVKNTMSIVSLFEDLGVRFSIVVRSDCQGALRMVRDGDVADRTKHLDVNYKFAHKEAKRMNAELVYIVRDENLADMLTRAVNEKKMGEMKKRILFAERK
eukprot:snap_masked-scaffold_69-processed-gene-0.32-mRNA-1 protein AED:1.00 eAED:1.00 QI:0/-1/0/0/-1/1/1/0/151